MGDCFNLSFHKLRVSKYAWRRISAVLVEGVVVSLLCIDQRRRTSVSTIDVSESGAAKASPGVSWRR